MFLRSKEKSKGFTMIELIATIAIVGVMAAIAVPRFINQTSNARKAAISSLEGAINSAVSLSQTQYVAENKSGAATITMNGQSVTTADKGYPTATAAGIGKALQTVAGFTPTYAGDGTTATYDFDSAVTDCNLVYTAATGAVSVTTTGC